VSWSKRAKKAFAGLSALPDFLGVESLKETPSGWTLQSLRSRVARAEILSGHVKAKRVTNFIEITFSVRELFFPSETMYLTITSTFQVCVYLGLGGRVFRAPLRSLVI